MTDIKHSGLSRSALTRRGVLKASLATGAAAFTLRFPSANAATDKTLRIGWVAQISGPGAGFGETTEFVKDQLAKLFDGGLQIGGSRYSVEILVRDSQSSVNTAAQVTTGLMTRDKVDLIVATEGYAPITGGQMAAISRTPMLSTLIPSDALVGARGGPVAYSNNGKPWTFHFLFSAKDIGRTYVGMWEPVRKRLNDKVGVFFVDQPASRGFADPEHGVFPTLKAHDYSPIDGGMFKPETTDFSNQVASFKDGKADYLTGFMFPSQFVSFWRSAAQGSYRPEVVTVAGAFLFPAGINALGDRGDGMSTEIWWSPALPYTSSLTGQSCAQLAKAWEDKEGTQWTPVLGYAHAMWEVAVAALKASGDPKDKEALRAALSEVNIDTIVGKVDFAAAPKSGLASTALVGGQWRKARSGPYTYDLLVTYAGDQSVFKAASDFKLLSELN
ncbi:branched-chain amino acid ABC transporter substrate-binding protein [Thioclava dalianensis]|uniref:Branched-chain amino acid ABC transporter substrate-binding protein n=1 Tax=Thioclava dalianensis TaxID=1185766 RepID=A0A074TLW0_9RHOB|nr:ABC transporter substrate-binding protein [Thioclava dalianensis]KEP71155.1 branched-chain amino acid ABC transporter substrate-binding protein [Thioclava dalianensis]SFN23810.1 branched-chain amino acid transport system substrate-binding protein [Thioclava dalianensis]